MYRDLLINEIQIIVDELRERLEIELQDTSLKKMRQIIKKIEKILLKVKNI